MNTHHRGEFSVIRNLPAGTPYAQLVGQLRDVVRQIRADVPEASDAMLMDVGLRPVDDAWQVVCYFRRL